MRRRVYLQYGIDFIHKDLFYWCASVAEVLCPPDATELSAFDRGCEISWTWNSELRSCIFQGPFANPSRHESHCDCMILRNNWETVASYDFFYHFSRSPEERTIKTPMRHDAETSEHQLWSSGTQSKGNNGPESRCPANEYAYKSIA